MCKVKFYPWARNGGESGRAERDLYVIKQCMISDIDINYAPNGVPSFFAGTSLPTLIQLRLGLQEIEYHTQRDYGVMPTKEAPEFFKIIGDKAKELGEDVMDAIKPGGDSPQ
jgi:hypothetical protein